MKNDLEAYRKQRRVVRATVWLRQANYLRQIV